jgi:H+/Cl- antiporter ClcA
MKKYNNSLWEGILLSAITGIFTGTVIFLFKFISEKIISFSGYIYLSVRENPLLLPLLFIGLIILALLAFFFIKTEPDAKGGGIPTSLIFIRGQKSLKPIRNLIFVFLSSLATYLAGIPLGNEGPSVQMGCAVGNATAKLTQNKPWTRYIMSGGASAGFASATGSVLSGILFAFEEAHKRFSPINFVTVSSAVVSSAATTNLLSTLFRVNSKLFSFNPFPQLPIKYLWVAAIIGFLSGIIAIIYTKTFKLIDGFFIKSFNKLPLIARLILIFSAVGVLGFISPLFLGSGHSLIDELIHGELISPFVLIVCFIIRALVLMFSNLSGVTGGLFLPTLTVGAIIGSLASDFFILTGIINDEHRAIIIIIGIISFLASASRIPLTALAFSIEVLSGINNLIPITLAVLLSYLIIEAAKVKSFTDKVIHSKLKTILNDKESKVVSAHMTVEDGSFVVGKEIRDILWPPNTVILSVEKKNADETALEKGDNLHIRYKTYNEEETLSELKALLGSNKQKHHSEIHKNDPNFEIPEM